MENSIQRMPSAFTKMLSISERVTIAERQSEFISNHDLPTFVKLCAKLCAMYGLQLPEAQLLQLLKDFIDKHYAWCTFEHWNIAFELNASNQLEKKVEPFGALTVTFLGDVLTCYKPLRDKANLEWQREVNENKQLQAPPVVNEEDWLNSLREDIDAFRQKKFTIIDMRGSIMLEWLETSGRIAHDYFSDEEYRKAKVEAKRIVFSDLQMSQPKFDRMVEGKKEKVRDYIRIQGLRELYKIYLSKQ